MFRKKKARIALIGNNGTGKTTFFQQILTAIRTGHSQLQVTGNVAYVPQIPMDQADLSGREQTKALIVKALQQKPAVLLLDEPSANLDPQQQQWLKQELQHFSGIVLLISHDLNLLNSATEIWSVEQHQLTVVKGNYAKFKQQRARQLHKQESLYQQQQKEVHRLQQQIAKRQQQAQRMKKVNGNKLSFSEKKANSLSGHFDKGEKNYKKVLLL
ncbi:hypothetical protein [Bombilactobacillus thymidiniphilus]|uniref:AAA+ ATPase domain-containing protein n=1 Tax=Bombilactobacillus thymidiniphilus TaxID=2923363 RepID=A0ABY4PD22_9LACO|nr:hypothetical protein [Bombilactobacillus thymidiniphilus]UQS83668.1 hypothetical protein MOO47_00250 [Bombilactobacillus thymidiniphilus]